MSAGYSATTSPDKPSTLFVGQSLIVQTPQHVASDQDLLCLLTECCLLCLLTTSIIMNKYEIYHTKPYNRNELVQVIRGEIPFGLNGLMKILSLLHQLSCIFKKFSAFTMVRFSVLCMSLKLLQNKT